MANRLVNVTEFKAKCLALLDGVEAHGDVLTLTRRGLPIATVRQLPRKGLRTLKGAWRGKVEIKGDIVNFDTTDLWEALVREPLVPKSKPRRRAS